MNRLSETDADAVEEFHGPYGTYHVSEVVLQKIWRERAFEQSGLRDDRGREIVIESPGSWNRLEGPDFKDAVILFDGECREGDVEIHFATADWRSHGHDRDPNFNGVILHVVYHPPLEFARPTMRLDGGAIPCLALLPSLWYSLEEYAAEDSIVSSTGVEPAPQVESLLGESLAARREALLDQARWRWDLKRHFAARRIERLGWEGACHQTALEILGYARNRVPMLMVAERFPLPSLRHGKVEAQQLLAAVSDRWLVHGCRPANHPLVRLEQYCEWVAKRPRWPENWREMASGLSFPDVEEASFGSLGTRSSLGVTDLRDEIAEAVFAGQVAGTKSDTLVCDGLLPLAAVETGANLFDLWFHWLAGDGPESCLQALRQLQVLQPRRVPMSNGWLQGVLGLRS